MLAPQSAGGPLRWEAVESAIREQHPALLSARLDRAAAEGKLLAAQGAFDLQLTAKFGGDIFGFYEAINTAVGVEQPTTLWGTTVFGGYKLQTGGRLPDYDPDRTNRGGAPIAGIRVPLLRDGEIDGRRTDLAQAGIDRQLVEPGVERTTLDLVRLGARAYWAWWAAGRRLAIAEDLLKLAEVRDAALAELAKRGLAAPATVEDNRRLLVARRIGVVAGERRLQSAGMALSLFLRDGRGEPVHPDRSRLPSEVTAARGPDLDALEADLAHALRNRPEIRRVRLLAERVGLDRRLAENRMLPNVDLVVSGGVDFGGGPYKDKDEARLEAGVEFKLPLQRRGARGRLAEVDATLEKLALEERFARDRITVELRDAVSEVASAWEQVARAAENVRLNDVMQRVEAEAVNAGNSNLLLLNLREQATADARAAEADALAAYHAAQADYRAAKGL